MAKQISKTLVEMSDEELFRLVEFNAEKAESTTFSGYSYWRSTWQMFIKSKFTKFTLLFILALLVFCILQPYLPGQKSPTEIFLNPETGVQYRSVKPCSEFWFGTNGGLDFGGCVSMFRGAYGEGSRWKRQPGGCDMPL